MANSGKASKYVSDVAVLPGSLLLFLSLLLLAYLTSLHYLAIPSKNQFFITFNACPHLNRKHSIFGEVVDNAKGQPGTNVLQRIQSVATDKKNRPVEPVVLLSTEIVVDPALEAQEIQDKRLAELIEARERTTRQAGVGTTGKSGKMKQRDRQEQECVIVGKYLRLPTTDEVSGETASSSESVASKPKMPTSKGFGDFSKF